MKTKYSLALTLMLSLVSIGIAAPPASSSLVSQFQAQSPKSVWIPANQPVPAQGSTVNLAFDRSDFSGPNADRDYQRALAMAPSATVTYVIADLGYVSYGSVTQLSTQGTLGYLVLLDFGQGQSFNYAYVGYMSFATAAQQFDAAGSTGLYSFTDGGNQYLWAPSSVDLSVVTGLIDAWKFQTPRAVSNYAASQTLDCAKLDDSSLLSSCQALGSRVGSTVQIGSGAVQSVKPTDFIGLMGASSQISGGLVQASAVQLPASAASVGGGSLPAGNPTKYSGPEFSSFGQPVLAGAVLTTEGRKLDQITSLKINGAAASYKINSASELEIDVPKDLAPGKYDIEITSTHGKLTHLQAFTVKVVVPTKTLEFKGDGRTFGYEELLELTKMAKQIGSEYTSVKCIVNAADAAVAQRLVSRGCDYVGAIRLRGKEISTEAKSTYKGDGFWFKIVANG